MKIYNLSDFSERNDLPEGCTVALGNFDGVHAGHKALFSEALKKPLSAVWTFTSPAKPNSPTEILTDTEERLRLFSACGLGFAVLEEFEAVRNFSPRDFVAKILCENLAVSGVVCGYNFRFGKGGAGNAEELKKLCAEFSLECTVIPPVEIDGMTVSSSAVKEALQKGDAEKASVFLGRNYSLCSTVLHGKSLGRKFKTPTVNQKFHKGSVIPKSGVYATAVRFDGKVFPGATNVGCRPTIDDGNEVNCETNIIGFSGELYGKEITVEFLKFVREETVFSDEDALFERIKKDIAVCSEIFRNSSERNKS